MAMLGIRALTRMRRLGQKWPRSRQKAQDLCLKHGTRHGLFEKGIRSGLQGRVSILGPRHVGQDNDGYGRRTHLVPQSTRQLESADRTSNSDIRHNDVEFLCCRDLNGSGESRGFNRSVTRGAESARVHFALVERV